MKMETVLTKECKCPSCGGKLDAASCMSRPKGKPSPGDISVCLYCGQALQFTNDLGVAVLPDKELEALHPDARNLVKKIIVGVKSGMI